MIKRDDHHHHHPTILAAPEGAEIRHILASTVVVTFHTRKTKKKSLPNKCYYDQVLPRAHATTATISSVD